jgi:lysine 2,3-aminomutase
MKKLTTTIEETEPPSLGRTRVETPEETEPPSPSVPGAAVSLRLRSYRVPPAQLPLRLPGEGGLVSGERTMEFRRRFFQDITNGEWNNWRWQIRHRIRTYSQLSTMVTLSEEEESAVLRRGGGFPLAVTPYYASLMDADNPADPIRRSVIPTVNELLISCGEAADPLGEDADSPVPGLVHRYPDRVLFLVTGFCSTYCRYCTRSRLVGHRREHRFDHGQWERAIAYIETTPAIRDVLLSGGDPLTLPDDKLEWLLWRLRRIPHVEFLRIGTKVPAVLPQRITPALVKRIKRYHPVWMSIHFTHPAEITPEVRQACGRLADAGIPLGSQTVLLAGINDDTDVMRRLVQGLLTIRVRPYYLYQCDPIAGSRHFRTPVAKGIELIQGLRGHTTGYAVPSYVIDAPGGGGKIPLLPEYRAGREEGDLLLRNYAGDLYRYPDPAGAGR